MSEMILLTFCDKAVCARTNTLLRLVNSVCVLLYHEVTTKSLVEESSKLYDMQSNEGLTSKRTQEEVQREVESKEKEEEAPIKSSITDSYSICLS